MYKLRVIFKNGKVVDYAEKDLKMAHSWKFFIEQEFEGEQFIEIYDENDKLIEKYDYTNYKRGDWYLGKNLVA